MISGGRTSSAMVGKPRCSQSDNDRSYGPFTAHPETETRRSPLATAQGLLNRPYALAAGLLKMPGAARILPAASFLRTQFTPVVLSWYHKWKSQSACALCLL